MKRLLPLLILLAFVFLCWLSIEHDVAEVSYEVTALDIPYGTSARQQIDAYLPANRNEHTPLLIMFHGGGWIIGDRKDNAHIARALLKQGIASVSVGYRLVDTIANIAAPQVSEDVRAGVAKALSLRSEWGIANGKLGLFGISAGGHLSLLYAYAYDSLHQVNQVIAYAGPSNLQAPKLLAHPIMAQLVHQYLPKFCEDSLDVMNWSPAKYVNANSPRTILIHGLRDTTVDPSQSISLDSLLRVNKVSSRLVMLDSVGHSIDNRTLGVVIHLVADAMLGRVF